MTVRGLRVILSSDLARIYDVEPKVRLSKDDMSAIRRTRSQSVTLKRGAHVEYAQLERRAGEHDHEPRAIIQALRQLMAPPEPQ